MPPDTSNELREIFPPWHRHRPDGTPPRRKSEVTQGDCVMQLVRIRKVLFPTILAIAGLIAGAWITAQTGHLPFSYQTVHAAAASGPPPSDRMSIEAGFAPVVEKIMPSVVNVSST